uniref:Monooxygenase FAD-binding n=1 Tax=Cyanothece sp. (strain PCC 7425 / ATCC 29141) TaxID=395961 RepID=B8HPN7_CYAP4
MVATTCRIGIIGAGTSGVYLASLLSRQGFEVTLFEKASHPRTEGCGILLVRAGMEALQQGNPQLCQQMINAGSPVQRFEFRNLRGGLINAENVTYEENELPGLLIHRTAILSALLEQLPPGYLHCNAELESVSQTEDKVMASFSDGSYWEGDLLVGADGIGSKVRQFVVPGVDLCYLGDLVWRGVVNDSSFCPPGHFIVYVRGRGIYANFFHLGHGLTHWGFFVETELEESEIGVLRPQHPEIPPLELAKLPEDARAVIAATPAEQITARYSYDIDPLPHLYQGRIVLIGDAGHAKSPTRARGMTAGFEDALCLARYLGESVDIGTALQQFEAERLPIVHEYQRTSRQQSQRIGRRHHKSAA